MSKASNLLTDQKTPDWIYSPAQAIIFGLQIAGTMATIFLHRA